jgi:drug/metabolite transporter (DMT)-like permease
LFNDRSSHLAAVGQALFVTFLWSTSWVFIKIGLEDVPALTFAGLRYFLAFLCLLPFVMRPAQRAHISALSGREWARLLLYGVLFIAVAQGAQYLALSYLPAVTVSLLLNFVPATVALLSIWMLAEKPAWLQWLGIAVYLLGVLIYFYPVEIPAGQVVGFAVAGLCVLAVAGSSIFGRRINREAHLHPLTVTVVSMGFGSVLLLGGGIATTGLPQLTFTNWAFVVWLAVVNTALTFPLWNHTLRTLSAVESSIINSTMLVQVAVLAWLFLAEQLSWQEIGGMAMAGLGALIVHLRAAALGNALLSLRDRARGGRLFRA